VKASEKTGLICLFAVYILWGSTFLGIRLAVESIPPLVATFARHSFGGVALLILLLLAKRWQQPSRQEWMNGLLVGSLTAGISNGALMWSGINVPSAYSAIAFTTMPLFMMLMNWIGFEKVQPSRIEIAAMPLGLLGCGMIVFTGKSLAGGNVEAFDVALLLLCPSVWAFGSLLGRRREMPKNILVSASIQMIGGALLMIVLAALHGDWQVFAATPVTARSFWGLWYLAIGGSLLGYTAFATAIRNLDSQVVGTYAFVNPLIAIFLGGFFGEDVTSPTVFFGISLSLAAVGLTFIGSSRRRRR
jgi:drug/metabolite transporter (DMT)-like permease